MKKYLSLTALLLIPFLGMAQHQHVEPCLTDELYEQYLQEHPEERVAMERAAQTWENYKKAPAANKKKAVLRIPVVFHVIHEYGPENISKAQIEDQIRILNEDFRRTNSDATKTRDIFKSVAADTEIEFVMATKDPDGNCTEGINRVYSPLTNNARNNVKALINWPSDRYLNVWVVKTIENSSGDPGVITLGFAQFPWQRSGSPTTDGIVLRADYTGSIGTSSTAKAGRTATHEVGHWLGLYHTFQGGCSNVSWGEKIDDTPKVAEDNQGCQIGINSCTNESPDLPDQVENYMDYSSGSCMNMFTLGQKDKMHSMIASYRSLLVSSANASFTGINGNTSTCVPVADFSLERKVACEGSDVTFEDLSYNATITSRTWTFDGGTPATSSALNPTVTYTQEGTYPITLEVGNSNGSTKLIRDTMVIVRPSVSTIKTPFGEGMEGNTFPPNKWTTQTEGGGNGWSQFTLAGSGSSKSARATINANTPNGARFELIMPSVDVLGVKDPQLSFDIAHARRDDNTFDRMQVYASRDCGQSWVLIYQRAGAQMATAPNFTGVFVPTASQWQTFDVLLSSYVGQRNLLIKFVAVSDAGNNIYIDNVNISSLSSSDALTADRLGMSVYPNPAQDQVKLKLNVPEGTVGTVSIHNALGQQVRKAGLNVNGNWVEQSLNTTGLEAGVYLVQVKIGNSVMSRKLVITK